MVCLDGVYRHNVMLEGHGSSRCILLLPKRADSSASDRSTEGRGSSCCLVSDNHVHASAQVLRDTASKTANQQHSMIVNKRQGKTRRNAVVDFNLRFNLI